MEFSGICLGRSCQVVPRSRRAWGGGGRLPAPSRRKAETLLSLGQMLRYLSGGAGAGGRWGYQGRLGRD